MPKPSQPSSAGTRSPIGLTHAALPDDPALHAEALLDEAGDESFPASDPPALDAPPCNTHDALECLLDEALEETFPASDPIAVTRRAAPPVH